MSELRCDFEIELLVYGYLKRFYDQSIPKDINKLCILMYGKDSFCWLVKTKELKDLGHRVGYINNPLHGTAVAAPIQKDKVESDIFSFQQIKFQLSIQSRHGQFQIFLSLLSKYVKVSGTTRIICKKPYYEFQKYFQFRFASDKITISQNMNDDNSPTFYTMNCEEHVEFICYINIFTIELMNNASASIKPYRKEIKMKPNISYVWFLKDSVPTIEEFDSNPNFVRVYSNNIENATKTFYYSPSFDNGNWRLRYIEHDNKCKLCLQLISKPLSANYLGIKWTISVHYNNTSNTWETSPQFHPHYSPHLGYWSGLLFENENIWIKEYETKSLWINCKIELSQAPAFSVETISMLQSDIKKIKNVIKKMSNKQETDKKLLIAMINEMGMKNNNNNNKGKENNEKEMIQKWLAVINLSRYFNAFISNGYESLNFIKEISNKTELLEIGVELKGHQTKLLAEIKKLSYF